MHNSLRKKVKSLVYAGILFGALVAVPAMINGESDWYLLGLFFFGVTFSATFILGASIIIALSVLKLAHPAFIVLAGTFVPSVFVLVYQYINYPQFMNHVCSDVVLLMIFGAIASSVYCVLLSRSAKQ